MSNDDFNKMLSWFADPEHVKELDLTEMMALGNALMLVTNILEPIYLRHTAFDSGTTNFLFKM